MKRMNKKGFTIVELVVVIAVIAILAAIMIPTFSGVTQNAKDAADKADAQAAYTQYVTDKAKANQDASENVILKIADGKYVAYVNGSVKMDDKNVKVYASVDAAEAAYTGTCVNAIEVDGVAEVTIKNDHGTLVENKCPDCGK